MAALGLLAAFAIMVGIAQASASADDAVTQPATADQTEQTTCVSVPEALQMADAACEERCRRLRQTLIRECNRLTGSAKAECLRDAREDYEACLAQC